MKLNLVVFRSALSGRVAVEEMHADLLSELRRRFELTLCEPGEESGGGGTVVAFIASGGSERSFIDYYPRLPAPLLILADGAANSLAAALEILSWIGENGGRAEILHGSSERVADRIAEAAAGNAASARLTAARIGVIGPPSDWLIASSVDREAARSRWGSSFIDIGLDELEARMDDADANASEAAAAAFASGAGAIDGPGMADVVAASRVYLGLKALAADRGLDALTLRCFDILDRRGTTGCMALALLNREGLVSGCEGDQRTAFTMLLAREFTGQPAFMANPARVDPENGTAVFAHCTIDPGMTSRYIIRTHFESGAGVGIQGIVPEGPVTVLKIGGPSLDRYFVSAGCIMENLDDARGCRTQLEISLEEDVRYFLRSPLSNHHVIVLGDHARRIASFLDEKGLARVK